MGKFPVQWFPSHSYIAPWYDVIGEQLLRVLHYLNLLFAIIGRTIYSHHYRLLCGIDVFLTITVLQHAEIEKLSACITIFIYVCGIVHSTLESLHSKSHHGIYIKRVGVVRVSKRHQSYLTCREKSRRRPALVHIQSQHQSQQACVCYNDHHRDVMCRR